MALDRQIDHQLINGGLRAFPENNVYGVKAGPTKGISDRYWIFLKPLPPGRQEIHTFGSCLAGTVNIELIYHLIVK